MEKEIKTKPTNNHTFFIFAPPFSDLVRKLNHHEFLAYQAVHNYH